MDRKIFKYPVSFTANDEFVIGLPEGARILDVQSQFNKPFIWALVDPNEEIYQERYFRVAGTGHLIHDKDHKSYEYIGTFQMNGGQLVFHLFEIVIKE